VPIRGLISDEHPVEAQEHPGHVFALLAEAGPLGQVLGLLELEALEDVDRLDDHTLRSLVARRLDVNAAVSGDERGRLAAHVGHGQVGLDCRLEALLDEHLLDPLVLDLEVEHGADGLGEFILGVAESHQAALSAAAPEGLGLGHDGAEFLGQASRLFDRPDEFRPGQTAPYPRTRRVS